LWEMLSGRLLATLQPGGGVWGLALSADGRLLASGGADGTVQLWSLTGVAKSGGMHGIQEEMLSGRLLATLRGHNGSGLWPGTEPRMAGCSPAAARMGPCGSGRRVPGSCSPRCTATQARFMARR